MLATQLFTVESTPSGYHASLKGFTPCAKSSAFNSDTTTESSALTGVSGEPNLGL